jgi:DNA-binding transcriptional MocR family regulator
MSVRLLSWVLTELPHSHPDLDPTARLILLILADHFNEHEGAAWPTIGRVANMAGVSEETVRRHLNDLVEKKLISKQPRAGQSNLYGIIPAHRKLPPTPTRGTPHTHEGVPPTPARGVSPIYTTLNEPLKNAEKKPIEPCSHGEPRGASYCALCRRAKRGV